MKQLYDIPYSRETAEDGVRKIDIFLPGENANGACIFFVHGGGWRGGKKEAWHAVMERFCEFGYVCTSAEYHLTPTWRFPKQIEDLRLAMSFVKSHAAEYGIDPDRIAVWGSSSGGHLAALLASIRPEDELGMTPEIEIRDTTPNAAVYLCSVFSLRAAVLRGQLAENIEIFLGTTEEADSALCGQASPLDRVTGAEPPCLMIVGDADTTTPLYVHEAMRDALVAKGVRVEHVVLPGVGHGYGYGAGTEPQLQTIEIAERFLADVLAKKVASGG